MQTADESSSTDIRDQLRKDQQTVLAELEALRLIETEEEAKAA